jgi:hypothetical protein
MIRSPRPRPSSAGIIAFLALCACAFAAAASAQFSASVTVEKKGTATPSGGAIVQVEVACVGPVLEAFVTLSQDDGAVSGDGPLQPICDGGARTYDVAVTAFEGRFHKGKAFASAFVLLCDEEGTECADGQDSRVVKLREARAG